MIKYALALLLISSSAFAASQTGITPTLVGTEGGGTQAYVGITPNTNSCPNGGVYFLSNGPGGFGFPQSAISIALAAKMAGKTVRIDFVPATPGVAGSFCNGSNIYVE